MTHLRNYIAHVPLFLAVFFLPSPALADWFAGDDEYRIDIKTVGEAPAGLAETLDNAQDALAERPAASAEEGYQRYRFEQDRAYMQKLMEAEGYYQAQVEARFDAQEHTAHFLVSPGPRYRFNKVALRLDDSQQRKAALDIPVATTLKAKEGMPASAAVVEADEEAIDQWVDGHNCVFTHAVEHEAVINHLQKTVDVTYRVSAGAEAVIGDIRFSGQKTIAADYLNKRAGLKEGECFRRGKINDARLALQKTGLVGAVDPELPAAPDKDGRVPLTLRITERAHHTIKAGANYSTDIGPGITAGWEDRNLFSEGEKLSVSLAVATVERILDAQFEKPYFLRDDQKLKLGATLKQEDSDAFTSTGLDLSAGVERSFDNKWLAGAGVTYGFSQIKDQLSTQDVALLSVPLFASQDKRDDVLNPTKGWMLRFDSAPFFDTIDSGTYFFKNRVSGNYYHSVKTMGKPVLAVRAALGSIVGVNTEEVPATERFYVGGGGSVRGYGYQLVGPLDAQNDPLGGRSFVETSAEVRVRVSEDYGFVTFIDGGNSYDASLPDFSGGMLWGAGIGLRYYTSFGPLRADIAVPLDKRPGVDSDYQLYFSIGQAF